jgi:hypothetical protein
MKLDKITLKKLIRESIDEIRKKQEEGAESDAAMGTGEADPNTDSIRSMEPEGPNPDNLTTEIEKYKTTLDHAFVMLAKDPGSDVTIDAVVNVLKGVTKHLESLKATNGPEQTGQPGAIPR